MDAQEIIYQDKPKHDSGVKSVYIGIPIFLIALGLWVFSVEKELWLILVGFVGAIFYALLFWFGMNRNYMIMRDRLRVAFRFGYHVDTLYKNIDSIGSLNRFGFSSSSLRRPSGTIMYPFRNVIAVKNQKGSFLFLSPKNVNVFYEQLSSQVRVNNVNIKLLGL